MRMAGFRARHDSPSAGLVEVDAECQPTPGRFARQQLNPVNKQEFALYNLGEKRQIWERRDEIICERGKLAWHALMSSMPPTGFITS